MLKYFYFIFQSNQNVLLCLPHRATSVLHLLEPRSASTRALEAMSTAAAADVAFTLLVLLIRPLDPDSGSQRFALQKVVAARVSTVLIS